MFEVSWTLLNSLLQLCPVIRHGTGLNKMWVETGKVHNNAGFKLSSSENAFLF